MCFRTVKTLNEIQILVTSLVWGALMVARYGHRSPEGNASAQGHLFRLFVHTHVPSHGHHLYNNTSSLAWQPPFPRVSNWSPHVPTSGCPIMDAT